MPQRDQVWNSLTRGRPRDAVGSGGVRRRRVAFGDGVLVVCLFAVAGLVLLGSLFMLLSWVTVTVPARELNPVPTSKIVWHQLLTRMNLCGQRVLWRTD